MDVNVLRRAASGGCAETWDLDAFVYGLKTLSGSDILVLALTLEELHND